MHESAAVQPVTTQSASHDHRTDDHGSIGPVALKVFIALCVLTCASLLTYTSFWQERVPQSIGRAVMLTVSLTKAYLVVAFFMHLWWESKWKYVVTFPALLVSVLLCLSLIPDVGQRTEQYDANRLLAAPEPMPYTVGPELKVSQPDPTRDSAAHRAAEHGASRPSVSNDSTH